MAENMKRLHISTERPYDVFVGRDILGESGRLISEVIKPCRLTVVSDDNVAPLYMGTVKTSLEEAGYEVREYVFPHGEASKSAETLLGLINFMAESRLTRADAAVALGGGVTGDLTGFAASIYLRGIKYVQIPTTVLAAVDSSVGGKTAIDIPSGKNLIGSFHQPELVICDCDTLSTLTDEVFSDGLAEAVKYAILCDPELFGLIERFRRGDGMTEIISRCIMHKAAYVCGDEHDHGKRAFLNLGHTPAHAIEKLSDYRISHGHAVAIGMLIMARAAEKLRFAKENISTGLEALLKSKGIDTKAAYSAEQLAAEAGFDKKKRGDTITLIIPKRIGECELMSIAAEELFRFFEAGL